jgi:hypothetical protein
MRMRRWEKWKVPIVELMSSQLAQKFLSDGSLWPKAEIRRCQCNSARSGALRYFKRGSRSNFQDVASFAKVTATSGRFARYRLDPKPSYFEDARVSAQIKLGQRRRNGPQ